MNVVVNEHALAECALVAYNYEVADFAISLFAEPNCAKMCRVPGPSRVTLSSRLSPQHFENLRHGQQVICKLNVDLHGQGQKILYEMIGQLGGNLGNRQCLRSGTAG